MYISTCSVFYPEQNWCIVYHYILIFFAQFQCNDTVLKMTTNFSDGVNFLHGFNLKFTIAANIVCIPVELKFSTSILCPSHHGQYFNSWSFTAFTVS